MSKTIKEMIEVMLAYENGSTIEWHPSSNDGGWMNCPQPHWSWAVYDYRVKREPLEIWVNMYDNSAPKYAYSSKEEAQTRARPKAKRKAVHFIEVIEDA